MRQIANPVKSSFFIVLLLSAVCRSAVPEPTHRSGSLFPISHNDEATRGCTVLTISKGDAVFFGGNDDYTDPDSYYWVDTGDEKSYGAIWIGRPDNVQQGVNERGLAYDANGLPRVDVNSHPERIAVPGGYTSYPIHILQECATVEEVIAWVNSHQWHSYMHDQMHFADATGDAVVISAGRNGEVVFTRKPPGDGFLVSTNFNVANPINGFSYPCWRYDRARKLLGKLLNQEATLTAEDAAGVLDSVHEQGGAGWTISSLVADLPNGVVYLYYFFQFDRPVVLHVNEELRNPRDPGPLSLLFPEAVRVEAKRRYEEIRAGAMRCRWVGSIWAVVLLVSLVLTIVFPIGGRRKWGLWAPAVVLLGPLALTVKLVAGSSRQLSRWRLVLLEATGDVMPTVLAFVVILVIIIMIPLAQSNKLLQLVLMLGLPVGIGWSVFHGPVLAAAANERSGHFIVQRLPHALVVANLGMGGISMIAMPLVNQSIRKCSLFPLSVWTILTWWVIAAVGAIVGGLLISLYERWAVSAGFRAWAVLVRGEGKAHTPSWGKLWWWILLSYVALFAGIVMGAFLQRALTV